MPRGDSTGPMGMGPMTGRGAGYCKGYAMPGFAGNSSGRYTRVIGGGRGFRRMYCLTGIPGWAGDGYTGPASQRQGYDEKTALKNQEEFLETHLKQVKERLKGFGEEN